MDQNSPKLDQDITFDPKKLGYEETTHRPNLHSRSPIPQNFSTPSPSHGYSSITPLVSETDYQSFWEIFAFLCPIISIPLIFLSFYDKIFLWLLIPILLLGIISIYICLIVPKIQHKNQQFLSQPNNSNLKTSSSPKSKWT